MMGHTHALIGALAGAAWGASQGWSHDLVLISAAAAGVAAIVPDIDHPQGEIRQRMGIFSRLLDWLPHRGITHTIGALAVFALAFTLWTGDIRLAMPGILGYSSHLIADMMTKSGIPLFLPFHAGRWWALPKPLRLRTAGMSEQFIAGLTAWALLQAVGILPTVATIYTTISPAIAERFIDALRLVVMFLGV
jgi:membrane-bound metal-dependent hydrolase YbcI (DUF457 family)